MSPQSYWKHCPECGFRIRVYSKDETYYCVACAGENESGPMVELVDGYE